MFLCQILKLPHLIQHLIFQVYQIILIKKTRFKIIPSVYLLLWNTETCQILLSRRFGTEFIDDETIYQAILRESEQELGLIIAQN